MLELTPFSDDDIGTLARWLYVPHVCKWFEHPESWLHEVENRNGEFNWIHHYIFRVDGTPVGFCQFYKYELSGEVWHGNMSTEGLYSLDYLIGEPNCLHKGYGKAMLERLVMLICCCNDAMGMIVQPDPKNVASCAVLASCGFSYDTENELFYRKVGKLANWKPSWLLHSFLSTCCGKRSKAAK